MALIVGKDTARRQVGLGLVVGEAAVELERQVDAGLGPKPNCSTSFCNSR